MTDANRAAGIAEELSRAENALAASALLTDGGFPSDAVSRLYYSLLFRIRALLLTQGLEPKSHEGALRLLSQHFVKNGRLEPEASHLFSRLMKYREEADYNPSYVFTTDDVRRLRDETAALASRIAVLIRQSGYETK
jgi:uncharacterized protein (UPF0332 family)